MKNLIYISAIFMFTGLTAQTKTNSTNVTEETKVEKTAAIQNGKIVKKETKVITKEVQKIELATEDKNKINQKEIETPVKVTKTIMIDNETDGYYDTISEFTYYKFNNEDYMFEPNKNGYIVSVKRDEEDVVIGKALKSSSKKYYIMSTEVHNGVGYFDENGNFVVEYYDVNNDDLVSQKYMIIK